MKNTKKKLMEQIEDLSPEEIADLLSGLKKNKKRGTSTPNNKKRKKDGKKMAIPVPLDTDTKRPNRFTKHGYDKQEMGDVEIDRKLWKNRSPTPRSRNNNIDIDCDRCGVSFNIKLDLIMKDDEGYHYICDDCITR